MDERLTAKIIGWNADRGFGFAETDAGEKFFVHIREQRLPHFDGTAICYPRPSRENVILPKCGQMITFRRGMREPGRSYCPAKEWTFSWLEDLEFDDKHYMERQRIQGESSLRRAAEERAEKQKRMLCAGREHLPTLMAKMARSVILPPGERLDNHPLDEDDEPANFGRRHDGTRRHKNAFTGMVPPPPEIWNKLHA